MEVRAWISEKSLVSVTQEDNRYIVELVTYPFRSQGFGNNYGERFTLYKPKRKKKYRLRVMSWGDGWGQSGYDAFEFPVSNQDYEKLKTRIEQAVEKFLNSDEPQYLENLYEFLKEYVEYNSPDE